MPKLRILATLLLCLQIAAALPDPSWGKLIKNSKYVVYFDVGLNKEFVWIPTKQVEILKGKPRDLGDFFINLSKSGKMVIIGFDAKEEIFNVDSDGFIINKTDKGTITKISIDDIKRLVTRAIVENRGNGLGQ